MCYNHRTNVPESHKEEFINKALRRKKFFRSIAKARWFQVTFQVFRTPGTLKIHLEPHLEPTWTT